MTVSIRAQAVCAAMLEACKGGSTTAAPVPDNPRPMEASVPPVLAAAAQAEQPQEIGDDDLQTALSILRPSSGSGTPPDKKRFRVQDYMEEWKTDRHRFLGMVATSNAALESIANSMRTLTAPRADK
jgi:hypothetical protein